MKELELSREELYDCVWKKPMRTLAKELHMSDVGLAKLCKRNGIPTPPQGYHLMGAGYKKDHLIVALPPIQTGQNLTFKFRQTKATNENTNITESDEQEFENLLDSRIDNPDPKQKKLIEQYVKNVRGRIKINKTDARGIVITPEKYYPIRVAPQSLNRACDLFREILLIFSTLGADIWEKTTMGSYRNYKLGIYWLGYDFDFHVEEKSKRVLAGPNTPISKSHYFRGEKYTYKPSGKLELEMRGPGTYFTLKDGNSDIEERIFEFVQKAYFRAITQQKADTIRKERMIKAVKRLEELDKIRRDQEFLKAKQKLLEKEAKQWDKSEILRHYISAVENKGFQAARNSIENENEWHQWLTWAREYINSMDPIERGEAGKIPSYPEPKEINSIPSIYLDYDDPLEAEEAMKSLLW